MARPGERMVRARGRACNGRREPCPRMRAMDGIEVVDIAHAIQLAVAPVFLFSGIGVFLGVLTNRLARIVDRARGSRKACGRRRHGSPDEARRQLRVATRRARYINVSITLSTVAALLVALVIALLFASTFVPINLAGSVAVLFVLAMTALVGALLSFLLEVRIAIAALRIGVPGRTKKMTPGLWPGVEERTLVEGKGRVRQGNRNSALSAGAPTAAPSRRAAGDPCCGR